MATRFQFETPAVWLTACMMVTACVGPDGIRQTESEHASLHRSARRVLETDIWAQRIRRAHRTLRRAAQNPIVLTKAADTLRAARYAALRGKDVAMEPEHVRRTASLIAQLEAARRQAENMADRPALERPPSDGLQFKWPVSQVAVSSEFGHRADPFRPHERTFHNGIDLVTAAGSPVFSAAPGTILRTGWRNDGCGLGVAIVHGNGYETEYCHLGSVMVEQGATVGTGSVIGRVGNTGRTTGAHLHFTVRVDGQAVDPRWMIGRRVDG